MQPPEASSGDSGQDGARDRRAEPLPPLVSAALEPADATLEARLERLARQSGGRARYTVLGELAQGGMGRILRAWDEGLAREVAMKVVPREPRPGSSDEERGDHERRLARFIDEARITGQLDHPGIVPVYEIGLDEKGAVFFTMPLVRGRTLKSVFELVRVGREGWSLPRAIGVMHTVCLTVAFAHSKGVVHRDLKPENVMVGPFGEAYVMDWGLALLLGRSEREGIVGTPAYMPPEQAAGRSGEVGPRSDVYSLGAILYELLSGRMPHERSLETRERHEESFEAVLAAPPRPLRELGTGVPPELAAICDKAMRRASAERYASALEMAADLDAWLAGRTVSVLDTGPWTRLRKWRARNRALALALDALVALIVVGGGAFFLRTRYLLREVEANYDSSRLSSYAASLSAADLGLRAHESGESRRRLEACDPALHGWEWRHLALRADASLQVLSGHATDVRSVAVSPDGARLASGSDDGTILLWDAATGALERRLAGHEGQVMALSFAPDGARLASASRDDSVRLWDARSGELERVLEAHDADVVALAFSPDGNELASGDDHGTLILSSVASGEPRARLTRADEDVLVALDYVPGSGRIACAYLSGFVRIWDSATLACVREEQVVRGALTCLDANGRRLALACELEVLVLDAETLELLLSLRGHGSTVKSVAFSADSAWLASSGFDTVLRVWDLATGDSVREYDGHDGDVNSIAFFPDGRRLVTSSEDHTLRVWDLRRVPTLVLEGHEDWVDALALSPGGEGLLSGSRDRALRLFDPRSGATLGTAQTGGIVDCVAWSARDELAFGCGDPVPRLAPAGDLAAWKQLPPSAGYPKTMAFDASGARLFLRDARGFVSVYDVPAGELRASLDTGDETTFSLAVTRDGRRFAAGLRTGEVVLWDVASVARIDTWRADKVAVTALAFSPDEEWLAAGRQNGTIALFAARSGALARLCAGHESIVSCLCFSPDGERLVSGSYDQTLRIWSLESDLALLALHGHEDAVTAVSFDSAGEVLASASKDKTVRLWRTARSFEN